MPSTSRGYPYPSGSDDVDIPGDMQALAAAVNTDVGTVVTNAAAASAATIQNTLADAAGDLIVASANDLWAKKPLGTDNHVLTVDTAGSGVAKVGWEDPTANPLTTAAMALKVNTATVGNLLTANQASIETDTTGFVGLLNVASMSASSAAALYGSKSLAVTSTGSDDTKIQLSSGLYTYDVPATAGQTYTFSVYVKSAATPRSALAVIVWRDAGGSGISTTTGTAVTTTTSGWTRVLVTGVAPAGTVHAQPVIAIVSSVANEVHYFDGFGFWQGAGGQWSLPGTPITNLGFYTDESVGRRLFQWDANNSRFQQTFGDTGWRDVTGSIAAGLLATNPTLVLYVRRHGSLVSWLLFEAAAGTATGLVSILAAVPAGFNQTPTVSTYAAYPLMNYATGAITLESVYMSSFDMNTAGWTTIRHTGSWSYTTTDAWPTTLPGTASGSIPA